MKNGKMSFNVEALKDVTKKEFIKLLDLRAIKDTPEEVWRLFLLEKKKLGL
jgi:hypothetical protein